METYARKVKDGKEFDCYFAKPKNLTVTVKGDANLDDTLELIDHVVKTTLWQTKAIAPLLQGKDLNDTCRKVFDFVCDHISYRKDKEGKEQIKDPIVTWAHRYGDCDDYTVFIASILLNLGIKAARRVAKYTEKNGFQHIYDIVPLPGKGYITMDPVVHVFNYEQKPIEVIDKIMELQHLSGVDDDDEYADEIIDQELDELIYGIEGLGKGISIKKITTGVKKAAARVAPKVKKVAKQVSIRNVLNVVNKVNPATVLLRNGVLACMKLNLFKVAGKMRYAYLTDTQAQQRGILMDKFAKLKGVKTKLEDIFFKAGGKPDNLKKAILNGKGNRDRSVLLSGLGEVSYVSDYELSVFDENTPLQTLLGELYYSENEGMGGLGELGDPATASAIAAASGAVGALAVIIKGIGSLFAPGRAPKNEDGDEGSANETVQFDDDGLAPDAGENASAPSMVNRLSPLFNKASPSLKKRSSLVSKLSPFINKAKSAATVNLNTALPGIPKSMDVPTDDDEPSSDALRTSSSAMIVAPGSAPAPAPVEDVVPGESGAPSTTSATTPTEGFWEKNKRWLKPTAIGVGVLGVVIAGVVIMKKATPSTSKLAGLGGIAKKKITRKRRKTAATKPKKKNSSVAPRWRKVPVALM